MRKFFPYIAIPSLLSGFIAASDATSDRAFFESNIRPILIESCYECHSVESGKAKGGLRLDDREAVLRGGDSGPAIVPGKPGESLLLAAIRHLDSDLEMPPRKDRLSEAILADFERWISEGAIDPRDSISGKDGRTGDDFESRKQHWSFRPPIAPEIPAIRDSNWPINDIDRFILAKLEENGIDPSADADAVTLGRRLSFDLTGLPPTNRESSVGMDWEKHVDLHLNSPAFGQRWGRHWLDVVRYAESNGKEANLTYPHAWRYRDYVIDAFDQNLPYDRFLTEQLAGDLLPAEDDAERARLLIAT